MAELRRPTRSQRDALDYVEGNALQMRARADATLRQVLEGRPGLDADYRTAIDQLRKHARVGVGFHPDRLSKTGRTVVEGLQLDGLYRNQFETGVSSGATSAFAGGKRDEWERRLFGGMYHRPGTDLAERPKYGALYLVEHPDGPCPRFGSCYFVLRPEISGRCSFTVGGSHEDSALERAGTLRIFEATLAALATHVAACPVVPLGVPGLTFPRLLRVIASRLPIAPGGPADRQGRALDTFVEAQVHGPIDLAEDVEALVADTSFYGTAIGDAMAQLTSTYGMDLRWHPGFTLTARQFPEEFRGFTTRRIAERVAVKGVVNAPNLGAGENEFVRHPQDWEEFGSPSQLFTSFRRVWHVLVLKGQPAHQWLDLRGVATP